MRPKKQSKTQILFSLTAAILCAFNLTAALAEIPDGNSAAKYSAAQEASIDRDIRGGYQIHLYKQDSGSRPLVAIDGIYLKNKDLNEVKALLEGAPNTNACVEYLDAAQNRVKVNLPRKAQNQIPTNADNILAKKLPDLKRFDQRPQWLTRFPTTPSTKNYYLAENIPVCIQASQRLDVEAAKEIPQPNASQIRDELLDAICISYQIGNLEGASEYLKELVSNGDYRFFHTREFDDLVNYLIAARELTAAKVFCSNALATLNADNIRRGHSNQYDTTLLKVLYAKVLLEMKPQNTKERSHLKAIEKEISENEDHVNEAELSNFAILLDRENETETAMNLLTKLAQRQQGYLSNPGKPLESEVAYSTTALALAKMQANHGLNDKAIETLTKALSESKKLLTTNEQQLNEQMGQFQTAGSDLETCLGELYLKKRNFTEAQKHLLEAIGRIEAALGPHAENLRKSYMDLISLSTAKKDRQSEAQYKDKLSKLEPSRSSQTLSLQNEFDLLSSVSTEIDKHNSPALAKKLNSLCEALKTDSNGPQKHLHVDLFDALVLQSRKLSDHELYTASNNQLETLKEFSRSKNLAPQNYSLLELEQAINSDRQKLVNNELWNKALNNLSVENLTQPLHLPPQSELSDAIGKQELLRQIAQVYECAGDLDRASILLNHAMRYRSSIPYTADDATGMNNAPGSVLLLLDTARLAEKKGNTAESHKFFTEAMNLNYENHFHGDSQQSRPRTEFNDLFRVKLICLANVICKNETDDKATAFVESILPEVRSGLTEDCPTDQRIGKFFYAWPEWFLASMYYLKKDYQTANQHCEIALKQGQPQFQQSALAGEIHSAIGDHQRAGQEFTQALTLPTANQRDWSTYRIFYLKKAFEETNQTALKSNERNIDLLQSFSPDLRDRFPESGISMCDTAMSCLKDTDPRKLYLARTKQRCQEALEQEQNAKKESNTDNKPGIQSVTTLAEMARLTAQSKPEDEWSILIELAKAEGSIGQTENAILHTKQALEKYSGHQSIRILAPIRELTFNGLPETLANAGHMKEARELLKSASEIVKRNYGADSGAMLAQTAQLFSLLINQKQYSEASQLLASVIAPQKSHANGCTFYMRDWEIIYRTIETIPADANSHALDMWHQILDAQRRDLPADHQRIAKTLKDMAVSDVQAGNFSTAIAHLKEAQNIEQKFIGNTEADKEIDPLLKPLEMKVPNKKAFFEEANRFRHSFTYIMAPSPRELPISLREEHVTMNNIEDHTRKEYEIESKLAPYGRHTRLTLENIITWSTRSKNWNSAVDAATRIIAIDERTSDPELSVREGGSDHDIPRLHYYSLAADTYVKLQKPDEAGEIVRQALRTVPDLNQEELDMLSEGAKLAGDKNTIEEIAKRKQFLKEIEAKRNEQKAKV